MAIYWNCKDGDELDMICREYYGYSRGSVEAVLADERNRELALKLPILMDGDAVYLPDLAPQARDYQGVRLWD